MAQMKMRADKREMFHFKISMKKRYIKSKFSADFLIYFKNT